MKQVSENTLRNFGMWKIQIDKHPDCHCERLTKEIKSALFCLRGNDETTVNVDDGCLRYNSENAIKVLVKALQQEKEDV